jgi:outer membrane biosynthesis protein TonB
MKLQHAYFPALLSAFAGMLLVPSAKADPVYKRIEVTFGDPVEIPGMVLAPGTYVMKLLDPLMDRDIVRFYDKDEKHMYAMVFAVRDYRLDAPEHTLITFEERAGSSPRAIKEWFYPGDHWGEQFVYPKVRTVAVAETTPPPTPKPVVTPQPSEQPKPVAQSQPPRQVQEPQQLAQAQPAPVQSQPIAPATPAPATPQAPKELPKTASDLPLVGLLGGISLLAGAILKWTVV